METPTSDQSFSILIINPNTSIHMTEGLKPLMQNVSYPNIHIDYFTAPQEPSVGLDGREIKGIPSINSNADSSLSALHCLPYLKPLIPKYDAFLVACYSAHPLVGMLNREIGIDQAEAKPQPRKKHVTGIFEASVSKSISLLCPASSLNSSDDARKGPEGIEFESSFGIISTGEVWKEIFARAVPDLLHRPLHFGIDDNVDLDPLFAGVETTGLSAVELHTTPAKEVERRMIEATERLINSAGRQVAAICLGCAGMSGMDKAVRQGCKRALGPAEGEKVVIVDGVVAGVEQLVNACKSGR